MTSAQRYRKKPVVAPWRTIEAMQWSGNNWDEIRHFVGGAWGKSVHQFVDRAGNLVITTPEGEMTARPSDWVIKGVVGEFYPRTNEIFLATYDRVHPK